MSGVGLLLVQFAVIWCLAVGNNQRNNERKARREAERLATEEARLEEEARRSRLTMWERIEESDASESVKELLHMLAEKCGLEN